MLAPLGHDLHDLKDKLPRGVNVAKGQPNPLCKDVHQDTIKLAPLSLGFNTHLGVLFHSILHLWLHVSSDSFSTLHALSIQIKSTACHTPMSWPVESVKL